MRLIFIRHAEPDYEHNTLTRKGFREAELLAPRAAGWNASRYFTSPLNRAKLTAAPRPTGQSRKNCMTAIISTGIPFFRQILHMNRPSWRFGKAWTEFSPATA